MAAIILTESHYGSIQEQDFQLAVLPWGATEAHNFHLPYGTDTFETEALVREAAERAGREGARLVVLPAIPVGVNTGQMKIPLTLNLNPSTQLTILMDLVRSLQGHGIQKLLVVNGHGGNDFKQILREAGGHFPEMMLATCNWFQSVDKSEFFEEEGDHADEMETSLMLHVRPELVRPLGEAGEGKSRSFRVEELNESWAWTERKWHLASEDTGIGDPRKASASKGKAYFHAVAGKLADLMKGLAESSEEGLYNSV